MDGQQERYVNDETNTKVTYVNMFMEESRVRKDEWLPGIGGRRKWPQAILWEQ